MPQVIEIKPTKVDENTIRVAAYARVSSDSNEQLNSFATQIKYFTKKINDTENWSFVDIYADEGITGTRTDVRPEFKRLLQDCKMGLIDKVLVKSISRFSRNTMECLSAIRELTAQGVSIVFEKENIDTATTGGEMYVSMYSTFAQEESIAISQNLRWGINKRMKAGKYITNCAPLGYKLKNGKLFIEKAEAKIVKNIFDYYLSGMSICTVADKVGKENSCFGNKSMGRSSVLYILQNEKYIGDALLQKYYTPLELPFKNILNKGERTQYYVENSQESIIDKDVFYKAQNLLKTRKEKFAHPECEEMKIPANLIICKVCGTAFRKRTLKDGTISYACKNHNKNKENCPVMPVNETDIIRAFLIMYSKLLNNKDLILNPIIEAAQTALKKESRNNANKAELNEQIADLLNQSYALTRLQSKNFIDNATFIERNNKLNAEINNLRRALLNLRAPSKLYDICEKTIALKECLEYAAPIIHFEETAFNSVVNKIIVNNESICFELKNKMILTEKLSDE